MPALNPVAKVVRLDFFSTHGPDTRVRDRIFMQYTGAGPSVADLQAYLTTVSAAWNTNISPLQDTGTTLTQIEATDLTSSTASQAFNTTARVGTRAGSALQTGVAAIVKFKIARRYRGGHPRIYLTAGVLADLLSSGQWTSSFAGTLATSWNSFIGASNTTPPTSMGTVSHVNVSYFSGFTNRTFPSGRAHPVATPRPTPVVDAVLSYTVNPILGSQRRRYLQSP